MSRFLLVGGDFAEVGRRSSLFKKIAESIVNSKHFQEGTYINGGNLKDLATIDFKSYDVVLWCANVSNDAEKNVQEIKKQNPKCILISSKRNHENEYDTLQIVSHGLKLKSNLILEFQTSLVNTNLVRMRVLDPLGNSYYHGTDPKEVSASLMYRLEQLQGFTRMPSKSINLYQDSYINPPEEFLEVVRAHGEKFQSFLTSASGETKRFLGNTSFRCGSGFPSARFGDIVMVSKRNLSKATIDKDSFVPVLLAPTEEVQYEGTVKPSVDTPIQLALYRNFPNIRFMLHSHVYVQEDAIWITGSPIPCGCLEEADRIIAAIPTGVADFRVNLRGHGCIIAADKVEKLKGLTFFPRQMPEFYNILEEDKMITPKDVDVLRANQDAQDERMDRISRNVEKLISKFADLEQKYKLLKVDINTLELKVKVATAPAGATSTDYAQMFIDFLQSIKK